MTRVRTLLWVLGTPVRLLLIGLIRLYRVTLAGLVGGQCRFHPSCSAYALDAVRVHGAVKGTLLALWRVARCGPFTPGGVDYVPRRGAWRGREYDEVIPDGPVGPSDRGVGRAA